MPTGLAEEQKWHSSTSTEKVYMEGYEIQGMELNRSLFVLFLRMRRNR